MWFSFSWGIFNTKFDHSCKGRVKTSSSQHPQLLLGICFRRKGRGNPDLVEDWEKLSAEQLDILSRMEHERWAAPLWMSGYMPGERNDAARIHPNLVPYDDLDQDTKDYDTEQVKQAAVYLQIISDERSEGLPSSS